MPRPKLAVLYRPSFYGSKVYIVNPNKASDFDNDPQFLFSMRHHKTLLRLIKRVEDAKKALERFSTEMNLGVKGK